MNDLWSIFIGFFQTGLFLLAQAFGGSVSLAILTISLVFRLALLPVSYALARRTQKNAELLARMQPELKRLQERFRKNPQRLSEETLKLYQKHGYRPLDMTGILGGLVQLPFAAGLYGAISRGLEAGGRFLWIGDIARPDLLLALLVAGLTALSSALAPSLSPQGRALAILLPAAVTLFFLWKLSAGIGLYWAVSSAVGILQSYLLQRRQNHRNA